MPTASSKTRDASSEQANPEAEPIRRHLRRTHQERQAVLLWQLSGNPPAQRRFGPGSSSVFLPPIPAGDRSAPGFPAALGAAICAGESSGESEFFYLCQLIRRHPDRLRRIEHQSRGPGHFECQESQRKLLHAGIDHRQTTSRPPSAFQPSTRATSTSPTWTTSSTQEYSGDALFL